jgi:iron complex outermembrane receptor protein
MMTRELLRRSYWLLLILILPWPGHARAQAHGAIEGIVQVVGAEMPMAGIRVVVKGTGRNGLTGKDGRFRIDAVPAGDHQIRVDDAGWESGPVGVRVTSGGLARVELEARKRVYAVDGLVVTAQRAYHQESALAATRVPAKIVDVPQSIQVVSSQLIEDFGATEFEQLYRGISGVTDHPYGEMVVRGFQQQEILFNGARGNPYGSLEGGEESGYSSSVGRLTNIERVEVLKGPASALYGSSQPGGIINYVTKKPKDQFEVQASTTLGQYQQRGGILEVTGPANAAKTVLYRAAAFLEDKGGFRYNTGSEDVHLVGGLSWVTSPRTRMDVEYERITQHLQGQRLRGVPVDSAGRFLTDIRWSAAEAADYHDLDAHVAQASLKHELGGTGLDATLRYLNFERHEEYHEPRGLRANGRSMTREFRDQLRTNDDVSMVVNLHRPVVLGGFGEHRLLLGADFAQQDWSLHYARIRGAKIPDIDLLAPAYGGANRANYGIQPSDYSDEQVLSRRYGIYLQDLWKPGARWQVLAGARADRYEDQGAVAGEPGHATAEAVTGRLGVVFKPIPSVSLYGNAANGFARPDFFYQVPSANGPFAPSRSRQLEIGAKGDLWDERLFATAALYDIVKTNELRPDPNYGPTGNNFSAMLPTGEVRSRGLEVDLMGSLTPAWTVSANYTLLDSEITRDEDFPEFVGKSWPNSARHSFGLLSRYNLTPASGFSVGVEHVGDREQPFAGIRAPAYTLVDLSVHQGLPRGVRLRINLSNVFDTEYATGSLFAPRVGNMPGPPRTLSVTLSTTLRPGET